MCGILGIISWDKDPDLSGADVGALLNRGPDGTASYTDKNLRFYHARLAVIDKKETSAQPIISACGNHVLICNGEIYNHKELKKEYAYDYRTTSDCEVILAAYSSAGTKGFERLKGMFAFALYDRKEKKVIIHRDAVGKKPLFYLNSGTAFIFSSSVSAIRRNVAHSFDINPEAVSWYLDEGYIRPDISFYKDIKPLMPGSLMEIDLKTGATAVRHIAPEALSYELFDYSPDDIMREAERLLDRSIAARLDGIAKPVLLFSGGVDSTVLAEKISTAARDRLVCLSLKPFVPLTYDDIYSVYAAGRLKINHIRVSVTEKMVMDTIDKTIALLDQPLSLYSYYLLASLSRKAKEFGDVLFLGEGGDEVFYGYSDIRAWFAGNDADPPPVGYNVGPPPRPALSDWGRKQITAGLLGHSFVKVDKATAEQQMEARCPYLDWDLMHFVRSIPAKYFTESGATKIILRHMLRGFPRWFVYRKKAGFPFNFRYLLMPFYRRIYEGIDFKSLTRFGVSGEAGGFSYYKMFGSFDRLWRLYVLSKFINN